MRFPSHLFRLETIRSEPLMAAMAVVAVGMFVGTWVIGPAITYEVDAPAPSTQARPTYEDMVSRPDPMPYRAATPAFDLSGPPNYAAAAKEQAQAQLGDPDGSDWSESAAPARAYRPSRARTFDRHRVY